MYCVLTFSAGERSKTSCPDELFGDFFSACNFLTLSLLSVPEVSHEESCFYALKRCVLHGLCAVQESKHKVCNLVGLR